MSLHRHSKDLTRKSAAGLLGSVSLWAIPMGIVIVVMGVLAAMYLGGTINSAANIRGFPIAIVNEDAGTTLADGSTTNVGDAITSALVAGIDSDEFDVRQITLDQAHSEMDDATLYGAIVLPSGLSSQLVAYAASTTSATVVDKPVISVLTNPRAGTSTPSIVTTLTSRALTEVNDSVGKQLTQSTNAQLTAAGHPELFTGTVHSALGTPLTVTVAAHNPLPEGTGSGLSAFYFALLIILCGFTGSMIVSTFVDSSLGFVPSELGPVYTLRRHSGLSRRATLLVKWIIMLGLALVVSALYIGIAASLGMPIDDPAKLWAFSAAAIWAVAIVAQTVGAIFGGIGLLVNLFIFIIFSLPSAGGTIPLEATPPVFQWLGSFEPMRQIYLGTRSILYFGGTLDSGLGRALLFCAAAAVIGVLGGMLATRFYDRKGLWRGHSEVLDGSHVQPSR